jgi:hypothetical protein
MPTSTTPGGVSRKLIGGRTVKSVNGVRNEGVVLLADVDGRMRGYPFISKGAPLSLPKV